MNQRYLKSLEFDKILNILAEYAVCKQTKIDILDMKPFVDTYDIKIELEKVDAILQHIMKFGSARLSDAEGATNAVERSVKGGILSMTELLLVADCLRNFKYLKSWFNQQQEPQDVLCDIFYSIIPQPKLESSIYECILSETEMADTASGTLLDIRRKISNTENSIRQKLEGIIKGQNTQKYLQDNVISLRSGRFVVPVKAEHKGDMQGVIHDVSSSGSTLFVEPSAVVEANAKILQLKNMEKEEIERILTVFSGQVASIYHQFMDSYKNMLYADLLSAKAQLAINQNANKPQIVEQTAFNLIRARHPLIDKNKVVPVNISLGENYDTMVITGPNTGGKTVSLKTAGLICTMVQYGMLVPCDEQSKVCVFSDILVDIGDEQSIEQSLSTFSGHIKNITKILDLAHQNTLVLLDELGAGTDPAEGAALAVSIIQSLRDKKAKIMATTHYNEMKIFAVETQGVQNASCEFDLESLKPTYKLSVGVPGKSNAFLISEKLGVPLSVIGTAKNYLSQQDKRFDKVLSELEDIKLELNQSKQEIENLKNSAQGELEKSRKKCEQLVKQGELELEMARDKAKEMVNNVQTQAFVLLDEMKQLQKQQNLTAQQKAIRAREIANKDAEKLYLKSDVVHNASPTHKPLKTAVKGEKVLVVSINKQAIVVNKEDKNNMVEVLIGMIKTKVNLADLTTVSNKQQSQQKLKPRKQPHQSINAAATRTANMEINLLGLTVDEAILDVDRFIDNAIISGLHTIYIVHGKGTGALRAGIQTHLKGHKSIKSFRLGTFGEGEAGVTVAELK